MKKRDFLKALSLSILSLPALSKAVPLDDFVNNEMASLVMYNEFKKGNELIITMEFEKESYTNSAIIKQISIRGGHQYADSCHHKANMIFKEFVKVYQDFMYSDHGAAWVHMEDYQDAQIKVFCSDMQKKSIISDKDNVILSIRNSLDQSKTNA